MKGSLAESGLSCMPDGMSHPSHSSVGTTKQALILKAALLLYIDDAGYFDANLGKLLLTAPLMQTIYLIQRSYCAVVCSLVLTLVSQLARSMQGDHVCMQQQALQVLQQ